MDIFSLLLLAAPVLGFAVSLFIIRSAVTAYGNKTKQTNGENSIKGRLSFAKGIIFINVVYAFTELLLILVNCGGLTVTGRLRLPVTVSALVFFGAGIVQGRMAAGSIESGRIFDDEEFGRDFIKLSIPSAVTVLSLIYFGAVIYGII
ncbi:MAG: hypothetical protein HUJ66_07200 [Oscillospiraceae bacterium]|nr:hypothetical protein [Oscillospiraceae bacterium]